MNNMSKYDLFHSSLGGDFLNNSGIYSLAGFIYQIKAFIYYLADLNENNQIGFEAYDDVSLCKKDIAESQKTDKLSLYNSIFDTSSGITAIQVKHTSLSTEDYEKVLFNWIILQNEKKEVNKFVLLVDKQYNNSDKVFPDDLTSLYNKIISSKSRKGLIFQVKQIINNNYNTFEDICKKIQNAYSFQPCEDIDEMIIKKYSVLLNRGGVAESTYKLRVVELMKHFQNDILEQIYNLNSYTCSYSSFRHIIEEVCSNVKDDFYLPSFSDFKKSNRLDMNGSDIIASRQYIQLKKCNLPEQMIKEHLIFESYYNSFKLRTLENLKLNTINDIEETTHYNFESVKAYLIANNNDQPINRLYNTINSENSYAPNIQTKSGSAIHLTKAETDESLLISWEDDA